MQEYYTFLGPSFGYPGTTIPGDPPGPSLTHNRPEVDPVSLIKEPL